MSTPTPHHAAPEQNELAHWFIDFQRKIEPHTNKIVLAIILATVAIVGYQVVSRAEASKKSEAWSKYAACQTADDFKEVADDHAGSDVEGWSRLEAARNYIQSGVRLSMTNRKASDESLENGKAQLEKLLGSTTTPDEVREQALSQMAVCLESLSDGDVKPAVEAYEQLLKKYPTTHYESWAKNRLEVLKKPETAEFYAWFRKAQPAPPERPKPQDVKPGELPNVNLGGDTAPPATEGTEATPPTAETKPAEGTPATEAPAPETKPEEAAAPAAESPAAPAEASAVEAPAAESPAPPAAETSAPAADPAPENPAEPAAEAPKP